MAMDTLIIWLVVGAIAGFLANMVMKGGGLRLTGNGLVDNIITGIVGAFVGGWLLGVLKVSIGTGLMAAIISALIGACVLIFGMRLIRR